MLLKKMSEQKRVIAYPTMSVIRNGLTVNLGK
jgi:hypothetical protein